ncbi:YHS domain-containing protein [Flavobacterium sp. DGU11]|uniref:YHS domain-containing protein n=1 Tax=Flavobacterium arundinis TaxID=3139143 RepID=A0ABU9HV39_9FLAO
MKKIIVPILAMLLAAACTQKPKTEENEINAPGSTPQPDAEGKYASTEGPYKGVALESPKDFYCGMDIVKYGPSDTLHYHGKVYGFCASVCKEEFKKEPEKYLAKK